MQLHGNIRGDDTATRELTGRFPLTLWGIMTVVSAGLLGVVVSQKQVGEWTPVSLPPLHWVSLILGLAPLMGAQLMLGGPHAALRVQAWLRARSRSLLVVVVSISALFLISGLLVGRFDPYATVIFVSGTFVALGTLNAIEKGRRGLTWADAAIWLLLWIPFDLRWNYDVWFGVAGFGYAWWCSAITVLAVLGWSGARDLPGFGYRLVPKWRDLAIALIAFVILAAIGIPIGLAVGFLSFPPRTVISLGAVLGAVINSFFFTAIPEELFFRGLLLHGLDQMYRRHRLNLLLSSLAFGLMHWNNSTGLEAQIAHVSLATLMGVLAGWTYRRSGNKLISPVLFHVFVGITFHIMEL